MEQRQNWEEESWHNPTHFVHVLLFPAEKGITGNKVAGLDMFCLYSSFPHHNNIKVLLSPLVEITLVHSESQKELVRTISCMHHKGNSFSIRVSSNYVYLFHLQ